MRYVIYVFFNKKTIILPEIFLTFHEIEPEIFLTFTEAN